MRMPSMNGIQFIRKAKDKWPGIKYFILTGFEITPEIQSAINEKLIHKYFRKPYNLKEMPKEIDAAFTAN